MPLIIKRGKLRGTLEVSSQISGDRDNVVAMALADERIAKWVTSDPKKVIFVPGKLVNIVIS